MPLIEKIQRRMEGWREKLLSRGRKLQLVASVLSALPIYYLPCFKLPVWMYSRIDSIRRSMLWSKYASNERGMPLLNWQEVCLPKNVGGLGVIDLRLQNECLLLRWLWHLHKDSDSLWVSICKEIYGIRSRQKLPASLAYKRHGSFFWMDLNGLRSLLSLALDVNVGNGMNVSFWVDNWAGQSITTSTRLRHCTKPRITLNEAIPLLDVLLPHPRTEHVQAIVQQVPLIATDAMDTWKWKWTPSGEFSANSLYKAIVYSGKVIMPLHKLIWRAPVPPAAKFFMILLLKNRILTQDKLLRRRLQFSTGCKLCQSRQVESVLHLFYDCAFANQLSAGLRRTGIYIPTGGLLGYDGCFTIRASGPPGKERRKRWMAAIILAMWAIWWERNNRIFREESLPVHTLIEICKGDIAMCVSHCRGHNNRAQG